MNRMLAHTPNHIPLCSIFGQHSMKQDLPWWKKFDGRQYLMEDILSLRTTFGGRQSVMEEDFDERYIWKTTFDGA